MKISEFCSFFVTQTLRIIKYTAARMLLCSVSLARNSWLFALKDATGLAIVHAEEDSLIVTPISLPPDSGNVTAVQFFQPKTTATSTTVAVIGTSTGKVLVSPCSITNSAFCIFSKEFLALCLERCDRIGYCSCRGGFSHRNSHLIATR